MPEENKLEWAVKQLQNNSSGGPSVNQNLERMYLDWNVFPRGRYIAVQSDPLRRDPLERNLSRWQSTIDRRLVQHLNPVPSLLD